MTEPQHMTALATANARRLARAELRRQVSTPATFSASSGELAEILAAGVPECMASMRLEDALRWVRRIPYYRINEILDAVGCTEWKKVGDLTLRQRSVLVNELRLFSMEAQAA